MLTFKLECLCKPSISNGSFKQHKLIKEVLSSYAASTGQFINPAKCSIMFGDATPTLLQDSIKVVLQVANNGFEDKYLGFPTPEGRVSKGKFQSLQDKIWKKVIQCWGGGTPLVEWG